MAASATWISRLLPGRSGGNGVKTFLQRPNTTVTECRRNNFFFNHLTRTDKHNESDYKYEVSSDPNEWKHVERLLPYFTVPEPKAKSEYPSGWRPPKEEALKLPYYVSRTKNHMLPVYMTTDRVSRSKGTQLSKIQGDLWRLHEELTRYIEEKTGQVVGSHVHEANCQIRFQGDQVYHVEQWLLSKGF